VKVFLVVCISALSFAAEASESPSFKKADELFKNRHLEANARKALGLFRSMHDTTPSSETAWRLAMATYFVGLRVEEEEKLKLKLFEEGRKAALKAAEKDPKCTGCHFWGAINLALYGNTLGPLKIIFQIKTIEKHLKKSLALDPTYAHGGAYRLLGQIQMNLPGIFGGDDLKAESFFHQALKVAPNEPLNYLFLSKLLKENLDREADASEVALRGLKLPQPSAERLESREALVELKAFVLDRSLASQSAKASTQ